MSNITPQSLEGTQAPSQLELLWEKYRGTVNVILAAVVVAMGINYGYKWYHQKQLNEVWGKFASTTGIADGYIGNSADGQNGLMLIAQQLPASLANKLIELDPAKLEGMLASSEPGQRPFILWTIAYSAYQHKEWDKAESTLNNLQKEFPNHVLVKESDFPVQFRKPRKEDESADKKPKKKVDLVAPVAGSAVAKLRANIAKEKTFEMPKRFDKPAIPAEAPKVAIEFKGKGKVVIALMTEQAPLTCKAFLDLLEKEKDHWNGVRVDQIRRAGNQLFSKHTPPTLHFGYLTTKGQDDRTKWPDPKPSTEQVAYEYNTLSHFEGAVSARMEGDKASVDRLYFSAGDNPAEDGDNVVFAYVVEGLDVLKQICALPLNNEQEEDRGQGTPADIVEIESVTKL